MVSQVDSGMFWAWHWASFARGTTQWPTPEITAQMNPSNTQSASAAHPSAVCGLERCRHTPLSQRQLLGNTSLGHAAEPTRPPAATGGAQQSASIVHSPAPTGLAPSSKSHATSPGGNPVESAPLSPPASPPPEVPPLRLSKLPLGPMLQAAATSKTRAPPSWAPPGQRSARARRPQGHPRSPSMRSARGSMDHVGGQ